MTALPPGSLSLRRSAAALLFTTVCLSNPLGGQSAVPAADPADVESIEAIIDALYDVISGETGAPRDWDRMRSLFIPGARLIPTGITPEGDHVYRVQSLDEWIDGASGYFAQSAFYERAIGNTVQRFGNVAHVFSAYDSRSAPSDAQPFARGINSIQLFWDGERWWGVTIFWDSERPDNPIPDRYLGDG